ncbi:MAG: DUF167 domain-containing protein [Bdellovibrionales bacterium]|nr:DUF167 domain-containing protein [Bdellovibrionales bacterium]
MKISVKVKPNSKQELVDKQEDGTFLVKVNAPPTEGKANKRVIELLAKHFKVPKSKIELISGGKSKLKMFKLPGEL